MEDGWTYKKENLKKASHILENYSWELMVASYSNRDRVPDEAGLYIFSTKTGVLLEEDEKEFVNPFYIGMSDVSIRSRFKQHIIRPEWKDASKCYVNKFIYSFLILKNKSKTEIDDMEDKLVRAFNPLLNKIYPKSSRKRKASESE